MIAKKANEYYENNKERLKEQARNKYRKLFNEEKDKKREYGKNRYKNMSKEDKQRLKEYQKTILKQRNTHKNFLYFILFSLSISLHFSFHIK